MTPFERFTFYTPCGEDLLTVNQPDMTETKLRFDTDGGSATLSWHQVRDLYCAMDEWLVNNAHLAKREN